MAAPARVAAGPADRPGSPAERVGFVWDQLFNGDLVFDAIADELAAHLRAWSSLGTRASATSMAPRR